MASRWAYEALAVHQFTDNKFSKEFYDYEKDKKYYIWKKDYWLKELNNKLSSCKKSIAKQEGLPDCNYELEVIKNELEKEKQIIPGLDVSTEALTVEQISLDKISEVETTLKDLKDFYLRKYSSANIQKENRLAELMKQPGGKAAYLDLRDKYSNISLEDFVTNSNDLNPIVEYNNELIQKSNPIYLTPTNKGFFNAHFYSPTKNLFGTQIGTFIANALVIWLMIFSLTVLLFFDGLRKILEGSSEYTALIREKVMNRFKK